MIVITLTVLFILLFTLLCWILTGIRGYWVPKMALICISLPFCLYLMSTMFDLKGHATEKDVPIEFGMYQLLINEPAKDGTFEGNIHILLYDKADKSQEPILHILPYTKELHQAAQEALNKMKGGSKMGGTREGINQLLGRGKGKFGENGNGNGKGGKGNGQGSQGIGFDKDAKSGFYELPPQILP